MLRSRDRYNRTDITFKNHIFLWNRMTRYIDDKFTKCFKVDTIVKTYSSRETRAIQPRTIILNSKIKSSASYFS